jgi:YidC/Oxa1 family membrane protein insertase
LAEQAVSAFQKVDKTGPIGFIATGIENGIIAAHEGLAGAGMTENSYGISICLFTLLIRTVTLPLTQTQLTSSVKMQQLQPLQKRIQAAFTNPTPEQEQQKNQALAQLYQAADVNPLAGCFPALIQIPVFISLYRALTNLCAEDKLTEGFLWLPSLEGPTYGSSTSSWFGSIVTGNPSLGWPDTVAFLTLPAILIVTQTISTNILTPQKPPQEQTAAEAQSNLIVKFLPLLIASFSINVPAGLSVYWIVNNILTTMITVAIKASIKTEDLPPAVQEMMAAIEGTGQKQAVGAVAGGVVDVEAVDVVPKKKKKSKGEKFRARLEKERAG